MRHLIAAAVTALYVVLEFGFNLQLIDAASAAPAQRATALQWLEPAGRLLGGLGCALLLARALGRRRGAGLVAAALSFPLMWFGQQALLQALVDASSPAQRRHALAAQLLSDSVRSGHVSLPGLEATGPRGVMLAAVFPLLAEGSDLPQAVLRQLRPLVEASAATGCTSGCRCGSPLPTAPDLERCIVRPLLQAQEARYRHYLQAHRQLAQDCAGDLQDAASCRLQREALEARLQAGTIELRQPLSRPAFDQRTGWERRAAQALLQRFTLVPARVPQACREGLLPAAVHARRCLYEPLLDRAVDQTARRLRLPGDDHEAETQGRQAYRSMIALPLALGFSLFFGLVNAAAVLARGLAAGWRCVAPLSRSAAAAMQLTAVLVALVVPAWLTDDHEPGAAQRQALIAHSVGPASPSALQHGLMWVLRTEPGVYTALRGTRLPSPARPAWHTALHDGLDPLRRWLAWP